MPSLSDIARHIQGLIELAQGRPDGLARFDLSIAGFWRSFTLFFLCAPFYLLFVVTRRQIATEHGIAMPESALADGTLSLLGSAAGWAVFPIAMIYLARALGLSAAYIPLIIIYNWSALPMTLIQTVPISLYGVGLAGLEGASLLSLMILPFLLFYLWRVTRVVVSPSTGAVGAKIRSPEGLAAGIVGFHLFLSVCMDLLTDAFRQSL